MLEIGGTLTRASDGGPPARDRLNGLIDLFEFLLRMVRQYIDTLKQVLNHIKCQA